MPPCIQLTQNPRTNQLFLWLSSDHDMDFGDGLRAEMRVSDLSCGKFELSKLILTLAYDEILHRDAC